MKKSRRFLKSIASQAHEESKRLRRERDVNKHASHASATIRGKQGPQHPVSRNWVEIFGKYMEEFTNLAGDITRYAETKPEPSTSEAAPKSSASPVTESKSLPTNDDISLNPWDLPQEDLEKLQHACKFMRDNAVRASMKPLSKAFNKVLEIAATVAEEATALSPARASSPIREVSGRQINRETKMQSKQETQETPNAKDVGAKTREAPKVVQETPKFVQEAATPVQEASTAEQAPSTSESAKMPAQNDNVIKMTFGKLTGSGLGTPDVAVAKDICLNRCAISELVNAVVAAKSELSSNASSCSSEGHGSDKAEGWTVIDPCESAMKGTFFRSMKQSMNASLNLLTKCFFIMVSSSCRSPLLVIICFS